MNNIYNKRLDLKNFPFFTLLSDKKSANCPICFALNVMFCTFGLFKACSPTKSVKICIDEDRKIFSVGWFQTGSLG